MVSSHFVKKQVTFSFRNYETSGFPSSLNGFQDILRNRDRHVFSCFVPLNNGIHLITPPVLRDMQFLDSFALITV
ncbi:hypothetical protein NPIL_282861 [Nephila pilipes]|uniref:Uncharacterized protein n=1 Tax=Nephila pilipes TaxID=299642 RepID=A0A8X6PYD5_NEPPI|nr:hypothetical protein NPIL_282861 [Nephila pilipes]